EVGERHQRTGCCGAEVHPADQPPTSSVTSKAISQSGERFARTDVVTEGRDGAESEIHLNDGGDPTKRREALRAMGISAMTVGIGVAGIVNNAAQESAELMNAVERSPADPDSLHDAAEDLYRLASDYAVDPDISRIFVRL